MMQNRIPTSKVPVVTNSSTNVNVRSSHLQNKNKFSTSNLQWHRISIHIPKGKNGDIPKNDQNKARPKSSRKNTKFCLSMPGIWSSWLDHLDFTRFLPLSASRAAASSLYRISHTSSILHLVDSPWVLTSPTSWHLPYNLGSTFSAHSGPPYRDSNPATLSCLIHLPGTMDQDFMTPSILHLSGL